MNGSNLSKKRRKYDEEFKSDVLKMVSYGRSIWEISKKLGISESMVYRWHQKSKPLSANHREKDQGLERENERLKALLGQTEMERDILKKSFSHFQPELTMKYQFIQHCAPLFPIHFLCQVMQVSGSAYYDYTTGRSHQPGSEHQQALQAVEKAFWAHKQGYGSRRLKVELEEMQGLCLGLHRIRRLMKQQELVAIQRQGPTVQKLCCPDHR